MKIDGDRNGLMISRFSVAGIL